MIINIIRIKFHKITINYPNSDHEIKGISEKK